MGRLERLAIVAGVVAAGFVAGPAAAQMTFAGAIQGTVTDEATGAPILLVTVVAASPALQGTPSELTDSSGHYLMTSLPPGWYNLLSIFGETQVKRENVEVGVGKVTIVNARIRTTSTGPGRASYPSSSWPKKAMGAPIRRRPCIARVAGARITTCLTSGFHSSASWRYATGAGGREDAPRRAGLREMRSVDEVLRLARELPAPETRRLLEELEKLEDEEAPPEENEKAWAGWIEHGPQGPLEDDESPWP